MQTINIFKEASKEYAKKSIKSLSSWYESIRLAAVRVHELIAEDKRIREAILRGLVNFFKVNKDGDVTERTERKVAPINDYVRTTDRKQTDTYKMYDTDKIKDFVKKGFEEEKAKLMSIISFNRWQFEHELV